MSISVNVRTHGFNELRKKLRELPRRVENRVLLQSLKSGAVPINKSIKRHAPVAATDQTTYGINIAKGGGRGLLKKSIGVKGKMSRRKSSAYVLVGARLYKFRRQIGLTKSGKPVWMDPMHYAHLANAGHVIKSHGRVIGHNPGTRFMERGTSSATPAAQASIEKKMAAGIIREAAKL